METNAGQLRRPLHPVGNRHGVGDVGGLERPLAEDDLAGVEHHDREQEQRRALENRDHQMRDRIDRRAEHHVDRLRVSDHVHDPERHHDRERQAAHDQHDLHARLPQQLARGGRARERGRAPAAATRAGADDGRLAPPPSATPDGARRRSRRRARRASVNENRQQVNASRAEREPEPQRAAGEEGSVEGEQARVLVEDGPVAGHDLEGAETQRIEERRRAGVRDVGRQRPGDSVADQDPHHAAVGEDQAARRGRDREQHARDQDHVRRVESEQRKGVDRRRHRPDPLRLEPGHQAAQRHAERHRDTGQDRRHHRAGEPAEEVVELADRQRVEDLLGVVLRVAHHARGDHRGDEEHAEHAHHQVHLHHDPGRVAVDLARRAADHHRVGGGGEEGEQEERRAPDPEDRLAELVAQLEAEDLAEHDGADRSLPARSRRSPLAGVLERREVDVDQAGVDRLPFRPRDDRRRGRGRWCARRGGGSRSRRARARAPPGPRDRRRGSTPCRAATRAPPPARPAAARARARSPPCGGRGRTRPRRCGSRG